MIGVTALGALDAKGDGLRIRQQQQQCRSVIAVGHGGCFNMLLLPEAVFAASLQHPSKDPSIPAVTSDSPTASTTAIAAPPPPPQRSLPKAAAAVQTHLQEHNHALFNTLPEDV